MISVVINSHIPQMASKSRRMWDHLLRDTAHEVIVITDARSMSDGYARGTKQAAGSVFIFAHHDIECLFDDFHKVFENAMASYDVIGVAGTDRLIHPVWTHAGLSHIFGQIVHPGESGGYEINIYGPQIPLVGGMMAMDGLFLAARRSVVEAIPWDAVAFDGFHFYDIDFTFRAFQAGFKLGIVSELAFFHESKGPGSPEYPKYANRFAQKHAGAFPQPYPPPPRMRVAAQRVNTLDEARVILRPAFWDRLR